MSEETNRSDSNKPAVPSNTLLDRARSLGDAEERVYSAELALLRRVAETSSDLVRGREWGEFRTVCGGIEVLEKSHAEAVQAWEQWLAEAEG